MAKRVFKVLKLSAEMSKFMNATEATRPDVQRRVWKYIKDQNLQLADSKTWVRLDQTLKDLFPNARNPFSMYELSTYISPHIEKANPPKTTGKASQLVPPTIKPIPDSQPTK